ncbi:hypothetical protein F4680DRAFT_147577 [Xylaria scruposa]|nr:hypothetical protein F4680DRAFT_147577 [Xylaria scruposa]
MAASRVLFNSVVPGVCWCICPAREPLDWTGPNQQAPVVPWWPRHLRAVSRFSSRCSSSNSSTLYITTPIVYCSALSYSPFKLSVGHLASVSFFF